MKQPDSTEMDRLLRRYARRNSETLPGENGLESDSIQETSGGAHMDADELNAYAEGALPEAARSRYFAHLADCDTCRKLVTDLTLASGVVSEEKRIVQLSPSPSKSWREWLAAILSPPVLRYAVPALALFGVIIVAIVMMRARREESFVAQNNEATNNSAMRTPANSNAGGDASSANTAAGVENHSNANMANSSSNVASQPGEQARNPTGAVTAPEQEKPTAMDQITPAASPADAPRPTVAQTGINDKKQGTFGEEGKSGETIGGTTTPQPTPAPVLAAPPPPSAGADNNKREAQAKQKTPQKDDDETVVINGAGSAATASKTASNEARRDRGRKASEPSSPNAGARIAIAPKSEAADTVAEKERSSETRSVGGRQFRRQGGVWIDTAYNSSRSTINVARGSEQYRALVADEPGLRAITQQLGGEVIVVWKSRAYRFY